MKLSFKTRIALHYFVATGIVVAIVFVVLFQIVKATIYDNLDRDLDYEQDIHLEELNLNTLTFTNREEWEEREHMEVQVNPVFVQVINSKETITDKSPNLKQNQLQFNAHLDNSAHFNTYLNARLIRQTQKLVFKKGQLAGYIITAMSFESSYEIIRLLCAILLISYPIIVVGLFFITRFLAGKSIAPICRITATTKTIHSNNLQERVPLPAIQDELYELTGAINNLLTRIEEALTREKQFTSDASHELRTPLASLRGTLEVLIRKPRERWEYEEKIEKTLKEIDRMTNMVEQLLFLARFDRVMEQQEYEDIILLTDEMISRQQQSISSKKLTIHFDTHINRDVVVPRYYTGLILENLISNAIKYSYEGGVIEVLVAEPDGRLQVKVVDHGIGIRQADMTDLFKPFFRSEEVVGSKANGTGLGLSIVQKAAAAIRAEISVDSNSEIGTVFTLNFLST